ncbi:MAG: alpha/beta hydrolase [Bryobacterales bacterium]|nr:alpha/beta hydrolase [Bryobacterales bacterium]
MFDISLTQPHRPARRTSVTSADGTTISTQEFGNLNGRPILFLHFYGGTHLMWMPQLASPLADQFRLVTLDHRGHGESGKPAEPQAYSDGERFADDIHAVITQLGLVRPVLAGWSMSGVLVGDYLAKYGEGNVDGVVLNAANNNMGNERAFRDQLGPAVSQAEGIFSEDLHEQLVAWNTLNRHLTSARTEMPESVKVAVMTASFQMASAAKQNILMRRAGVMDHLPTFGGLRAPLLLIHGNDDQIVLPKAAEQILDVNPRATLRRFDNVGHAPNWEQATAFNEALSEFAAPLR